MGGALITADASTGTRARASSQIWKEGVDVPVLSVVIPTFNEIDRIEQTLRSASEYLQQFGAPYEIIVIDNDSSDGTAGLVRDLIDRGVSSTRLVVERCRGKGAAVKHGILQSRGQFVVFMDADNSTPLSEFARFWPLLTSEVDVVIGSRYLDSSLVTVPQTFIRVMLSRVGNAVIRLLLIPQVRDTQLGFKGFRGEVARDLFGRLVTERWAFDVELLVMARYSGYRIRELGVLWREQGGSHIKWTAYLTSLADVVRIRWRAWRGVYARSQP
jgi:dolichyl-phosphate beta-glucosyltransferase